MSLTGDPHALWSAKDSLIRMQDEKIQGLEKEVSTLKDEVAHLEAIVSQSKILRKHACELTNSAYAIHKRHIPEFTDKMSRLGQAIDRYDSVFNIRAKGLGFIK